MSTFSPWAPIAQTAASGIFSRGIVTGIRPSARWRLHTAASSGEINADSSDSPIDAVVLPSARSPETLNRALSTARRSGAALVVLTSTREAGARAMTYLASRAPEQSWVGAAPFAETAHRLGLATAAHPGTSDVGLKRTAGLALARLLGWQRILLLDDDIESIDRASLEAARRLLDGDARSGVKHDIVGWAFHGRPDRSVAGHALNAAGIARQRPFLGGAALAIAVDRARSFFPPVYNDDIMFLLGSALNGAATWALLGELEQDWVDPFVDVGRAVREEFGDCLVSGAYPAIQAGGLDELFDTRYWISVIKKRRGRLRTANLILRLRGRRDAARCVEAALASHRPDWAAQMAGYARRWHEDQRRWHLFLARARPESSIDAAAAQIGVRPMRK